MKYWILFIFIFASFNSKGQEKIATNMYLYGDIENVVKGNVLINSTTGDPKHDIKMIDKIKKGLKDVYGINKVKSWHSLFIPGNNTNMSKKLKDNDISTIIILYRGTSGPVFNFSSSNTTYSNNGFGGISGSTHSTGYGGVSQFVNYSFDIYTIDNNFSEVKAHIDSKAANSSIPSITMSKIVNRFCKAMKKHCN